MSESDVSFDFRPEDALGLKLAFYDFISHVRIDSKETGVGIIQPYNAQRMFIDSVFDALERDIHWTVVLKARQLGITTFSILLDLFWLSYFPGIQGGLVTDTDPNKEKLRLIITRILEALPNSHKVPIVTHNRNGLVLKNGSSLDYLSAGVKKNSNLGRSRAYNYLHATEVGMWGDPEGVQALTKTLAETFPARLYIWESTAKGFNLFHNLWEQAKADDLGRNALFIGWWAKETYALEEGTPLFLRYAQDAPNESEQELIDIVKEKYDVDVSMAQLGWYRYQSDPARTRAEDEVDEDSIIEQEYPWHEDQAFMVTGSHFFPGELISDAMKEGKAQKFWGYKYFMGENFLTAKLEAVYTERDSQLKIWEEPDPNGVYVIGADPAYGMSENSDKHCLQVLRCYADCIEQVAEFNSSQMYAYQFAWVIAHVAGMYQNARYLLELNGPGEAVFTEFKNVRTMLINGDDLKFREAKALQSAGLLSEAEVAARKGEIKELGIRNVLGNVRTYMYARADSMESRASAWHWKTSGANKMPMLNQLRDVFVQRQLVVKSLPCLREMQTIVQEGVEIAAEGNNKDDRVMALALSVRAWIDSERANLRAQGLTKAVSEAQHRPLNREEISMAFNADIISKTLAANQQRLKEARAPKRTRWNW